MRRRAAPGGPGMCIGYPSDHRVLARAEWHGIREGQRGPGRW